MKRKLVVFCLALGLGAIPPAIAAGPATDATALPTDQTSLARLNDRHLGMVRAAVRECQATPLPSDVNPGAGCIATSVEQRVSQSGDPQLKAFNAKLPVRVRYNENRTNVDINRVFGRAE